MATPEPVRVQEPSAAPRRRTALVSALVIVAVIAAGIVVAVLVGGRRPEAAKVTPDAAPVVTTPIDAAVVAEVPPPPADAAVAAVVTITITGAPPSTEVHVRGTLVGVVPRIEVPRGTDEVILVLSRDGYRALSMPIVPDHDQTVVAKLKARSNGDPRESGEPTQDILKFPR